MKVERSLTLWKQFNRPAPNWGAETYRVELTPEDIGAKVTLENQTKVHALLELQARKMTVSSAYLDGLLTADDVRLMMKPYIDRVNNLKEKKNA